jgi:hypothetical protein
VSRLSRVMAFLFLVPTWAFLVLGAWWGELGGGGMRGGRGGAVVAKKSLKDAHSAICEARRVEEHCAEMVACKK